MARNVLINLSSRWLLSSAFLILLIPESAFAQEFPLRSKYSDIPTIETASLKKDYHNSIIVDVRSKLEFEVIHMDGANHIPLAQLSQANLKELRDKMGNKTIVFYCNGITCSKSYKATDRAIQLGVKNVLAYDAGIENWARAVPERTLILGKKQDKDIIGAYLISKDQFQAVLLPPDVFIKKSRSREYLVVDVREGEQREEAPIELQGIQQIPLGDFVLKLEKTGELPPGNMLILDNVGKQVRWLQYFLNEYGIKNYFFLKGGVKQWKEDKFNPQGVKAGP